MVCWSVWEYFSEQWSRVIQKSQTLRNHVVCWQHYQDRPRLSWSQVSCHYSRVWRLCSVLWYTGAGDHDTLRGQHQVILLQWNNLIHSLIWRNWAVRLVQELSGCKINICVVWGERWPDTWLWSWHWSQVSIRSHLGQHVSTAHTRDDASAAGEIFFSEIFPVTVVKDQLKVRHETRLWRTQDTCVRRWGTRERF